MIGQNLRTNLETHFSLLKLTVFGACNFQTFNGLACLAKRLVNSKNVIATALSVGDATKVKAFKTISKELYDLSFEIEHTQIHLIYLGQSISDTINLLKQSEIPLRNLVFGAVENDGKVRLLNRDEKTRLISAVTKRLNPFVAKTAEGN